MVTPTAHHRWYHLTPARFFIGLLVVQVFLLLSERFQWSVFNEKKGWTVLIAVGVLLVAVIAMLVWALVCLCLRRRFQFGVRSLLLFVVVLSVPLGWFAWEMQKAKRQREAVEKFMELGGVVMWDYNFDQRKNWLHGAEPTAPPRLRELLGDDFFIEVVVVNCGCTAFDDEDAKNLRGLTNLRGLDLSGTQITDNGLANLECDQKLEWLILSGTQITDNGLVHLKRMGRLGSLSLFGTQLSDEGVHEALPNCEVDREPPPYELPNWNIIR